MTKVKNIDGTSQSKCSCGSWLAHWERFSKVTTKYCKEKGCTNTDLVGAHVQKADTLDKSWYIIPLCKMHNASSGTLEVYGPFVSASKKGTCE